MKQELLQKYQFSEKVNLRNRLWPDNQITKAPIWCSVDLRDGNQALILPMTIDEKIELFQLLVDIGFKQIEVGFPSAAKVEFDFLRALIEKDMIPDDVTVQVLTQAREHLVVKSFEALKGCKKAIVHIYNSTSTLQRDIVFRMSQQEIKNIAVQGVELVKKLSSDCATDITLQYSPESFTGTELDYAVEVCQAVCDVWQPSSDNKVILNLPATVEESTPNIYADQIEYFCRNLSARKNALISLHAHNDRGTAVAATELGLMAGADRVEGTLFGNGERTGNVDIVTLALNMYSQGLDPALDLHDINRIIETSERVTKIPVHARQPYSGELVYTAFSGSHQDAINKGMNRIQGDKTAKWMVPYLPIDPSDLGRSYEQIIRINSQSGKGGVAYIMANEFHCQLPKDMHPELGRAVQRITDNSGSEIKPDAIWKVFENEFLLKSEPLKFISLIMNSTEDSDDINCVLKFIYKGQEKKIKGHGNGPIDACKDALQQLGLPAFTLTHYSEHALEMSGSKSTAIAYIQIENEKNERFFGAGIDSNINKASIKALFSSLNRSAII